MKTFIKHRINTIAGLEAVDPSWGVEIDLRSDLKSPGRIHLSHDPWVEGTDFRLWLAAFVAKGIRGPIILNTKEDNLEDTATALMREFRVESYFFLDTAAPTLVKKTLFENDRHFAVRLSKYEPKESLTSFVGKAAWVWVDCFKGIPIPAEEIEQIGQSFKICLVSPELQALPLSEIAAFGELYRNAHAVCTKSPQDWISNFGSH